VDPRLPPLNALRSFVVAARTASFLRAAEDLRVTPAAVSRSIRALEDYLGFPLFRRLHRQVALTPQGQFYFDSLHEVFDRIIAVTEHVMSGRGERPLVVCAYPSFIVNWLVPRWSHHLQTSSAVSLKMVTTMSHDVRFEAEGIDVAILTDRPVYPRCLSTRLFSATLVPVCRPGFLPPGTTTRDLPDWQDALLHSETRPRDWERWSAANAVALDTTRGRRFENAPMMYEAAVSGLGIGIGIRELLGRDFAGGRLVVAFPDNVETHCSFYVIRPPATDSHPFFRPFLDWLAAEVAPPADAAPPR